MFNPSIHILRGLAAPVTLLALFAAHTPAQSLERVSVDNNDKQGTLDSAAPILSPDGKVVVFHSENQLTADDNNSFRDVYLRDTSNGTTTLLSVNSGGNAGNGDSDFPYIGSFGSDIVFASGATDLVPNDNNGVRDVFLYSSGTMERVSVDSAGAEADGHSLSARVSGKGEYVSFQSVATKLVAKDTNGTTDIFLRDRVLGNTHCLSMNQAGTATGNGASTNAFISDDGKTVVFTSLASDLVANDNNGVQDIFLVTPGNRTRINVGPGGVEANGSSSSARLSRNGRYVLFTSFADNLVPGDTNASLDVFMLDTQTGAMTRESVSTGGGQLSTWSGANAVSNNGRYVLLNSPAVELPLPGTPIMTYVRDRTRNITYPIGVALDGTGANDDIDSETLASDELVVAFASKGTNLVTPDNNGSAFDVFVREPALATWSQYGTGHPGSSGTPNLAMTSVPVLGTTPVLTAQRSSLIPSTGFFFVGLSTANIPTNWGGTIWVNFSLIVTLPLPAQVNYFPFSLDENPTWEGVDLFLQLLELDGGASDGISFSNGLKMTLGY